MPAVFGFLMAGLAVGRPASSSFDLEKRPQRETATTREHPAVMPARRSHRLVHLFDFEETDERGVKLGRGLPMPRHWFAIGRAPETIEPGFFLPPRHQTLLEASQFSRYGEIGFDSRHRVSGEFSFHLGLAAADVGAFLEMGVLPAVPGSDYRLTAWMRTEELQRAGGVISAYLVDARGRQLPGSVVSIAPLSTEGSWQKVQLDIPGLFPQAAWLMVEVAIQQPRASEQNPLGDQQVVYRDVSGGLWLDDLAVWQLPSARIWNDASAGVYPAEERPRLQVAVRDVAGENLVAELIVHDHADQVVARERRSVMVGEPATWAWEPDLPGYGWYRAVVRVLEGAGRSGGPALTEGWTAWLWRGPQDAQARASGDLQRFQIEARAQPHRIRPLVAGLLADAGLKAVVLDAQPERHSEQDARAILEDALLETLINRGDRITLVLPALEPDVAASPPWLPALTPLLLRYGQRVAAWQVEGFDSAAPQGISAAIGQLQHALATWVPAPQLVLWQSWGSDAGPAGGIQPTGHRVLNVPQGVEERALGEVLAAWNERTPVQLRFDARGQNLDLEAWPVPLHRDHSAELAGLARQMISAWMSGAPILTLAHAGRDVLAGEERVPMLLPAPQLAVLSGLVDRLAGRRLIATWPLPAGQHGFLFDDPVRADRPMLVFWADEHAVLEAWLGSAPVRVDLRGNRQPLSLKGSVHRVQLSSEPQFIEEIDGPLARLRASLALDEPFIPSEQRPHRRTLTLHNPWSVTLTGDLFFTGPAEWQIEPQQHHLSLAAGATLSLPISLQFPVSEPAGSKWLEMRMRFIGQDERDMTLQLPMELGWQAVHLEPVLQLLPAGEDQDALVTVTLFNRSREIQHLHVFAMLAGHGRQEQWVARLEPGEQVIRRFRFSQVSEALLGHPVRVGVREAGGPAVLSYVLRPPAAP